MLKRSIVPVIVAALFAANLPVTLRAPAVAAPDAQAAPPPISNVADARTRASAGDVKGAIAELSAYVTANPGDRDATVYLGDLYLRSSDFKSAEKTYLAVLSRTPDDKVIHDRLGNAYAADDMTVEAIDQYERSLPNIVAYADLVRLHRHIGDLPQFVAKYRSDADQNSTDSAAQLGYGAILRDLHRSAEAAPYLQRAVTLLPRSCAAHTELGNTYLDLEQKTSAAAEFRQCLATDPNDYAALVDLSLTYDPRTQADVARGLLDRAYRLQPNRPEALVDYGYLADAAGRTDEAIAFYQRALATDVLARDAYVNLGYDYQEQRMFPLAEAAFLKGLSVSPSDGRLQYLLGQIYSEQGKRNLAVAEYAGAARSDEPEVQRAAAARLATLQGG